MSTDITELGEMSLDLDRHPDVHRDYSKGLVKFPMPARTINGVRGGNRGSVTSPVRGARHGENHPQDTRQDIITSGRRTGIRPLICGLPLFHFISRAQYGQVIGSR